MLNKLFNTVLMFMMITLPSIAVGQDIRKGKWWRNPQISKQLNLTDEEKAKLDERFVDSRRKMIALKSKVERERFDLENILESEELDEAAVMEQFRKVEKARANLANERFKFLIHSRKILGSKRFEDIKVMYKKMHRHKGDRKKGRFGEE